MNNRRIWFRLGGVLAAAAVCTGGAAVVSDRAQEAKNVQRAFLGAMETQMRIGCYPSETGSPADLTERERTELQTAYTSRVEQYYTEKNPCRKSFQAIRIEVNHELDVLETALTDGFAALKKGGRMSVITFHSLEDRIVKNRFREFCTGCTCPPEFPVCVCGKKPMGRLLDKKPIVASPEELEANPRSRSAKLRVIEKIRSTPFED